MRDAAQKVLEAGTPIVAVIKDYVEQISDIAVQSSVAEHFNDFVPGTFGPCYKPKIPDCQLERLFMPSI